MDNNIEKYYINKITGRLVKSNSKLANKLIKTGELQKHKCLYNTRSAKICLNQLFNRYPGIFHPPSSFTKIPRTYKSGEWRGFVIDSNFNKGEAVENKMVKIIGAINSWGELSRLKEPVFRNPKNIIIIKDPTGYLEKKITHINVKIIDNKFIIKQLDTGIPVLDDIKSINLIYNPVHNDFVPILKSDMNVIEQIEFLNSLNNVLITRQLSMMSSKYVIGVIVINNELRGVVTNDNRLIKMQKGLTEIPITNYLRLKITDEEFEMYAKYPPLKKYNKILKDLEKQPDENANNLFELIWDPLWKRSKILINRSIITSSSIITSPKQNEQIKTNNLLKMENEIEDKSTDEIITLESIDIDLKENKQPELKKSKESIDLIADKNNNIIGYM